MNSNEPDRLSISKSDRKHYDRLLEEDSPFHGQDNKIVFMMAMITGFLKGGRMEIDRKEGYIRTEYLNNKEKSLIKAIAVSETGGLEILADKRRLYSIAEEYAAGGIALLTKEVFGPEYGSYARRLELQTVEELERSPK